MIRAVKNALKRHLSTSVPEQQFFTIAELLARWKDDRVTFSHLRDWVEHQGLVFGARVRDTGSISERTTRADGAVVIRSTTRIVLAGPVEHAPLNTLYFDSATLLKILTASEGTQVGAPVTYSRVDRAPDCGTGHLSGGGFFSKDDLVAPLAEVHRIENLFRFGKQAPVAVRAWRWLLSSPLSRLVALLMKLLGKDSPSKPAP